MGPWASTRCLCKCDLQLAGNLQQLRPKMAKMPLTTLPRAQVSLPAEFTISAKDPSSSSYPGQNPGHLFPLPFPGTNTHFQRVAPESFLIPDLDFPWTWLAHFHVATLPCLPHTTGRGSFQNENQTPLPGFKSFKDFLSSPSLPLLSCPSLWSHPHPRHSIQKYLEFLSYAVSGLCDFAPSPPSSPSQQIACLSKLDKLSGWQVYPAPSQAGFLAPLGFFQTPKYTSAHTVL